MEAREDRDPGYDDWFDEPEPLTETQSSATRGVYEDADEVWVLPEDEDARGGAGQRKIVVGGRTLTMTQLAIIGVSILAVFFSILAAAGAFNSGKTPAPRVTPPPKKATQTAPPTTAPSTQPTSPVPSQSLLPGDTGPQVKILQQALISLGFLSGPADGDYGPATMIAVEKFQLAQHIGEDGKVGPETLNALQKALSG
ncbi:MAG TPA: peptidoglycan-binding domain-containing protein [Gaiellaceae bacterium]|nr:peptidoglycan-binding domain-containing protein [Gaiellaceae bacterium]